jgi:hypothetical protein
LRRTAEEVPDVGLDGWVAMRIAGVDQEQTIVADQEDLTTIAHEISLRLRLRRAEICATADSIGKSTCS